MTPKVWSPFLVSHILLVELCAAAAGRIKKAGRRGLIVDHDLLKNCIQVLAKPDRRRRSEGQIDGRCLARLG